MVVPVCFCHGGDDKGHLLGVDIVDIEIRSRIWDWGSAVRFESDAVYVRGKKFPHLGWAGNPNLAWSVYRMKGGVAFALARYLQALKTKDIYIYDVECGECRFFDLFNSRKRIHLNDFLYAILTEEQLAERKRRRAERLNSDEI